MKQMKSLIQGSDSQENSRSDTEKEKPFGDEKRSRFGKNLKAPIRNTSLTANPYDRRAKEQNIYTSRMATFN